MHDIAVATENLSPSHQYVPWIVMDGAHTDDIENKAMVDLTALVCETYKVILFGVSHPKFLTFLFLALTLS